MLESKIEQSFKRYCVKKDVLCLKMIAAGDNGYPDRLIIGKGFMFFIEFKRPSCYPSPLQIYIHETLRNLGQTVFCFNSSGKAEETLDNYLIGIIPHLMVRSNGITRIIRKRYRGI